MASLYTPLPLRSLDVDSPATPSLPNPLTVRLHSYSTPLHLTRSHSISDPVFSSGGAISGGLGNLADELADAWSEGDEDADGYDETVDVESEEASHTGEVKGEASARDSGIDVADPRPQGAEKQTHLAPNETTTQKHGRHHSSYDGSEYGVDSDRELPDRMPLGLVACIDQIESLARRGVESIGTDMDGVVQRVEEHLRDLDGQSAVENGTSRLITTNSALSTYLHHQTRLLHSLAYPLFSPLTPPPTRDTIDELLPLLQAISETMPRPAKSALTSLSALHNLTADVAQTLTYLSDTLHMSRQVTTAAARHLKSALEMVRDMVREEILRDDAEMWLTKGDWDGRLARREAGSQCREVVDGFEQVCEDWRRRLVAQTEEVGA